MKAQQQNPFLVAARLSLPLASTIAALFATSAAQANDGTWLGADGNWSDGTTWNGGSIADGSGFTANFTGIDIDADKFITLTAPQTIGNITFTDASTASHNLVINGAETLTLAGTPVINVTDMGRTLTISSVVDGLVGFNKTGPGILSLSNANIYTSTTTVTAGLLKLDHATALPGGVGAAGGTSRLSFNGGVIGLTSDFSRSIGINTNQVWWNTTGGGFAAFGDNRMVNLGGAGAWVKWSSSSGDDRLHGVLYLSDSTATHTVTVANSFDLLNGTRTVSVADGAAGVDAVLSGSLHNGGASGKLTKNGLGTLVLTGAYTVYASNSLPTTVNAGMLSIGEAGWLGYATNTGAISIAAGATFNHNSSAAQTLSGIISGGGAITKTGTATLTLTNANSYSGNTTVNAGTLTLSNAPDPLNANPGNDASTVTIAATGAVLDLTYTGTDKVDKLFIGTTQMPAGVYGAGNLIIPQITGTGTLTVLTGPTFSSWIAGTFANGTVPLDKRGPNDDPDNDGIRNLIEYAIAGQDPTVGNATIGTFNSNTLNFTKRADTTGLTYAIQDSADLGLTDNWAEVTDTPPNLYVNDGTTISYTLTPGSPPRNFIRLRVIQN